MSSGRDEMMERWSEESKEKTLVEASQVVDNFLVSMCKIHDLNILSLSAIILARMVRMNMETMSEKNLYKLMDEIRAGSYNKDLNRTMQ